METVLSNDAAKFLDMAESLPIEMRLAIIDRLLESVQPRQDAIDRLWLEVAERRSGELKSGKVEPIQGADFLANARKKLDL